MNLIVFQTNSIGCAYQLAQESFEFRLEILELSILGQGALVIFRDGNSKDENSASKFHFSLQVLCKQLLERIQRPEEIKSFSVIENLKDSTYQAFLSMNDTKIKTNLLILEGEFLGEMFEAVHWLTLQNPTCEVHDLRLLRGSEPRAYAFVSNFNQDPTGALNPWQWPKIKKTWMSHLSPYLGEYLDIFPGK